VVFVGPIHGFDPAHAWSRQRVREHFAVPEGRRLIWISAGGGGDGRDSLEPLARAIAADDRNFVLAGYGPLHRGELAYAPNLVPLTDGNASRFFSGIDAAISAGGENSHQELLAAGVPTLFYAQTKGLDRQDRRIQRAADQGLCALLPDASDPQLARSLLEELLTGELGVGIRRSLDGRSVPRGALLAAVELLLVCESVAGAIDRRALLEVASWRRAASDELARDFVANTRAYRAWRELAASPPEIAAESDRAAARWWASAGESAEPLAVGAELRALGDRSGVDSSTWNAILAAFARHPGSRSESIKRSELLDALRAIDAHGGAIQSAGDVPSSALRDAVLALARDADARASGVAE
jgi:hypothetical protein